MKKGISLFIISVLLILSVFVCASIASEKTIKLTWADNTPPTGMRGEAAKLFLEEIEKQTNGRVQVDVFWAESLLKGKEILKGVKEGVVDIGFINSAYYPEQLLINGSMVVFPRGPVQYDSVFKVNTRILEEIPEFKHEFQDLNQKILFYFPSHPMAICFREPITSVENLKGKRVRAPGHWFLVQLKGAGAVPVSIPWGDTYMALQTGTIDGVYTGLESIHRAKLEEVAPYIFTMNKELWGATIFYYTINIDKFNSLPEDIQSQLVEAGQVVSRRFGEIYDAIWDKIIKEQEEMGCTITHASPEDIQKWMASPEVGQLREEWIKLAKEGGVKNPEQIMEKMNSIINEAIEEEKG